MKDNYADIIALTDNPPLWYDQNGTPRFAEFHPELCPNIYSDAVFLILIACQLCGKEFKAEMHNDTFCDDVKHPKHLHYGDPPPHDCVGDTMNCYDKRILQAWKRTPLHVNFSDGPAWTRVHELEVDMQAPF